MRIADLKVERLVVDGDGEGGVVLVVDADEGAAQPHAAPPLAARHLRLRGVVRKDARGVVEHEPPDYWCDIGVVILNSMGYTYLFYILGT